MNSHQSLWWNQAQSDLAAFEVLRQQRVEACHCLHYLQMTAEKISKAYMSQAGPPPRKHDVFVKFLRELLGRERQRGGEDISRVFGFRGFAEATFRLRRILPVAYELQRLSPALAADGPNTEYLWPHASPVATPATTEFSVWTTLVFNSAGRDLLRIVRVAVGRFPEYADL